MFGSITSYKMNETIEGDYNDVSPEAKQNPYKKVFRK